MKTCIALLASMLCVATPTLADDDSPSMKIDLQSRVSYLNNRIGNDIDHSNSGFKGEYFLLSVSGQINDQISYSWRQRLNKKIDNNNMFDATDWLYVDYKFAPNWSVAAGKQEVLIGGYEYDRNPIDVNAPSEFWNNISPFQFGASASYATTDGNHRFTGQVSQSPFNMPMHRDMLSYSLFWAGKCGMLSTLWSVNMVETTPYHYISYISLGNRIDINNASLELDFMNRAAKHQTYLFKDCSVMARLDYRPIPQVGIFGKCAYDVNNTDISADPSVLPGTELTTIGGGVELYPVKDTDVRLSLGISHSTGTNSNPSGTVQNNQTQVRVGFIAKLNVFSWKK